MSSESPKLCDASPLTDGELHLLAERHPELDGFSAGVMIGSADRRVIDLVEAFLAAFGDSVDTRFGLAALSAGERSLFSERRPEFGVHEIDLIAATSDARVAKLLDATTALFGLLDGGAAPLAREAKEPLKKEALKKEAEVKEAKKEPVVAELKEEKKVEAAQVTPVIAAMAPSAVPAESAKDRAAWADRMGN